MKQFLLSIAVAAISLTVNAQTKIYEFPFDNSYSATVGTGSFSANDSTSFTTDRHGNANGALNIINAGCNATLPGLPYGKASRSVALWTKINEHNLSYNSLYNMLFKYGASSHSNAFSGSAGAFRIYIMSYNNNAYVNDSTDTGVWNHFVFNFEESDSTAKIYKNGVEVLSETMSDWNTLNNNDSFHLGTGPGNELWFNGAVDDLKIYDYALSAAEVAVLYNPTASIRKLNEEQNLSIYPNPANNILHIEAKENTNINILNILGAVAVTQKLQTGNNTLDVSNLTNGVYFIRNEKGGAVKFIKE